MLCAVVCCCLLSASGRGFVVDKLGTGTYAWYFGAVVGGGLGFGVAVVFWCLRYRFICLLVGRVVAGSVHWLLFLLVLYD